MPWINRESMPHAERASNTYSVKAVSSLAVSTFKYRATSIALTSPQINADGENQPRVLLIAVLLLTLYIVSSICVAAAMPFLTSSSWEAALLTNPRHIWAVRIQRCSPLLTRQARHDFKESAHVAFSAVFSKPHLSCCFFAAAAAGAAAALTAAVAAEVHSANHEVKSAPPWACWQLAHTPLPKINLNGIRLHMPARNHAPDEAACPVASPAQPAPPSRRTAHWTSSTMQLKTRCTKRMCNTRKHTHPATPRGMPPLNRRPPKGPCRTWR